jgi:hypothetical protein
VNELGQTKANEKKKKKKAKDLCLLDEEKKKKIPQQIRNELQNLLFLLFESAREDRLIVPFFFGFGLFLFLFVASERPLLRRCSLSLAPKTEQS